MPSKGLKYPAFVLLKILKGKSLNNVLGYRRWGAVNPV